MDGTRRLSKSNLAKVLRRVVAQIKKMRPGLKKLDSRLMGKMHLLLKEQEVEGSQSVREVVAGFESLGRQMKEQTISMLNLHLAKVRAKIRRNPGHGQLPGEK